MSASDRPSAGLHGGLDSLDGSGTVQIDHGSGVAEIDVVDVDRIGVRIRGVRVDRDKAVDIEAEARALPERLRALPDPVAPVEIAPTLGGARLRTRPDGQREFFEVDVTPHRTDIRRTRIDDDGDRAATDWTMTRDQLERLVDQATGPGDPPDAE